MKILQVTQRYPPSIGGSQLHVQRISEELVKRGHDVTVLTTSSSHINDVRGVSAGCGFSFDHNLMDVAVYAEENGIKVYRFPPALQILSYLFTGKLFSFLRKNAHNFDIIHAHCYMYAEPDAVMAATRFCDTPYVLTAHDVLTTHTGLFKLIKKVYDYSLGTLTLKYAKSLIALTEENEKQYMSLGCPQNKITQVPNGVDFDLYNSLTPNKELIEKLGNPEKIVLSVGRMVKYKGMHHIIEAAPDILELYPDTKFVFLGQDQGYLETLKKLAQENNVLDKCVFTGKISQEEVYAYYSIADVFTLASTGEGFGIVALEAMSAGIPCVLADYGGLRGVLNTIGGLPVNIDENMPEQIANHTISLFENTPSLENEQLLIKEKYSWHAVAKMLEAVYGDVLTGK